MTAAALDQGLRDRLRAAIGADRSVEVDPEEQVALTLALLARAAEIRDQGRV